MRLIFTSLFALLFSIPLIAQNYSVSNVVFNPTSPDTLLPKENVYINFDYTKTGGDVRIGFVIYGNGNWAKSGWSTRNDDAGAEEKHFYYKNGGHVDSISIQFKDMDWTLLYDTVIPCDFTYHHFYTNNLQFTPASPGVVAVGDTLKYSFDLDKSWPDDVKIQPFALSNKLPTPKQMTSISPVYSGTTGSATGFITIDTLATVDQMMFQFIDVATNDTLLESINDVFFSFTNDTAQKYAISNVVCTPPSGSILKLNERVDMTFDYTKPFGDVRIYMDPIPSEGSWNYGHSGSELYTANDSTGDANFVFYDESKIEQLRFRFQSISGIILHEHFEDVFFTVTADSTLAYSITDVELTPASPGQLNTGDTIKVKFKYTKPFGDVFFSIKPLKAGEINVGFEVPTLGAFSNNVDSVESYIIYDVPTNFDQIKIQMQTTLYRDLVEEIVPANFTFQSVPFSISDLTLTPATPDSINIRDSIKINFIYKNLAEHAKVIVTPMANNQALSGFDSSNDIKLVNNSDMVQAFIRFNDVIKVDQIKLQILSWDDSKSTNAILFEQLIDVNYTYRIPTSSPAIDKLAEPLIYPIPANKKLTIALPSAGFEYSIINISGQLILKGSSTSNIVKVDISKMNKGVYFTKIIYGKKQFSKKVIFK